MEVVSTNESRPREIWFSLVKGEARGEQKMVKLTEYLLSNGMMEELQKALADEDARAGMYEKYGINTTIELLSNSPKTASA